jgi:hypothetical protein
LYSLEVVFPGSCLPHFQNFENCFELFWSRPTNVTKQVQLISCYFTTSLDGGGAGYVEVAAQDMWRAGGWRNQQ